MEKLNLNEINKMKTAIGRFSMVSRDSKSGAILDTYTDTNVIVLDAKETIVQAIAGEVSGHISTIKIGEDFTNEAGPNTTPIQVQFTDNNPSADTITLLTGGLTWADIGVHDGMTFTVSGSQNNDTVGSQTYTAVTVTPTVITLDAVNDTLVTEGPTSVATFTFGSISDPADPQDTFNNTTGVWNPVLDFSELTHAGGDYVLAHSFPNNQTVSFTTTIIGADINYGVDQSKNITSAVLLAGSGKYFAYKRIPAKSISTSIDISVQWEITYL